MSKKIIFVLFVMLLVAPTVAFAVGTGANTTITAFGNANTLNYKDTALNDKTPVNSTDLSVAVSAEYGFTGIGVGGAKSTAPSVAVSYLYSILNDGNNADTFTLSINPSYGGGANGGGWTVTITGDAVTGGNTISNLGEDATAYFYVTVLPGSTSTQAPNGSFAVVTAEAITSSRPVGVYSGANGIGYGGIASAEDASVTTINAAQISLTRSQIVDAPTQYITNAGAGHEHDPVPGAVITYTLNYQNTGNDDARKLIIVDKVPASCEAAHVGASSASQDALTNVTITVTPPTGSGDWTAYYSISDSPSMAYGILTGWTTIDSNPKSFTSGSTIKYVKWEKDSLSNTDPAKTLTWGVMIQ